MESRIAVALSGGADSAVAAETLRGRGHRVFALHALFNTSTRSLAQAEAAAAVARRLGIELRTVDLTEEFSRSVVEPFCAGYAAGRTPNPCVVCNVAIKFGALLHEALEQGADVMATGHYARTRMEGKDARLLRALDHRADQSYFLYRVPSVALSRTVMPLGDLTREQVRARAEQLGLPVGRPSRDLCFVSGRSYHSFVAPRLSSTPGEIVDVAGRVLGRHRGLAFYTVGQRHGLDLALGFPAYVVRLVQDENVVVVGPEEELYCTQARVSDVAWVAGQAPAASFQSMVRVRYRAKAAVALVEIDGATARIAFHEPQKAVAPGQSLVMYNGDAVLGGGFLEAAQ
jgi:tRNA-specific 2-thiouridylase